MIRVEDAGERVLLHLSSGVEFVVASRICPPRERDWMEQMHGNESAAVIRSLAGEHPAANEVILGELASFHFLLWIVNGAAASWSAVAEMRRRSLASLSLPAALHSATRAAPHVVAGRLLAGV